MKTAEQIIKVLKERYIDAHCNPDFKGDKMEYIFQPLPEQESAELTDLKQYVTNLLYAAHEVNETPFNSSRFDKWADEQVNNLEEYLAQSHPQATVPSDEEINKKIFEICTRMRQWDGKSHPVTAPEMMQELATWFKTSIK